MLVVDDGSTDNTAEIAGREGATVVKHQINMGLAEAFRTEIEECLKRGADVIVHTDADGQYRAEEIPKLLKKIDEGYDLVLGSRFKGKIEKMPLIKRVGNKMFSKVISRITKFPISDGQTGFRAFTKELAEKVRIRSTHTYTQEQIIRAVKEKFRVAEVPIYFAKRGGNTKSRLMKGPFDYAIHAGVNMLRVYRDYEPLKFFGIIGLAFLSAGIMIGLWLVARFLKYGTVGRIPSTVLSMLLITVGIQIIIFGFIADKD
ncbi:glycosyltransferase family 2 protein [Candidatus Woesearchaeota archaeon]|nr:MAG: glycosyltransferase family 2 protein [Candidatus Woesearchaeota archaeon]